jgi:hypothetical protein
MDNTQQHESQQHRQRVQTVLICFVVWDSAVKTIRILAKAEDNSQLRANNENCVSFLFQSTSTVAINHGEGGGEVVVT